MINPDINATSKTKEVKDSNELFSDEFYGSSGESDTFTHPQEPV